MLGDVVGVVDGEIEGDEVVGEFVGVPVVGVAVGDKVGEVVVGDGDGAVVGATVGDVVGVIVGDDEAPCSTTDCNSTGTPSMRWSPRRLLHTGVGAPTS